MGRSFRLDRPVCPACGGATRVARTGANLAMATLGVALALILMIKLPMRWVCRRCGRRFVASA